MYAVKGAYFQGSAKLYVNNIFIPQYAFQNISGDLPGIGLHHVRS